MRPDEDGPRPVSAVMRSLALAGLLAASGVAAPAQPARAPIATAADAGGPTWNALSAQQRGALAPLQRDWHTIDAARKAKWLEVAARFPSMPTVERQRVQARMADWARMSPAERGRARLNFQESKQFTPEQKQQRWEAYQALPDEQRRALAERARPATEPRKAAAVASPLDTAMPKTTPPPRAAASAPLVKPVAPTIVQARPGATTTLMTQRAEPPAHQKPGQPKIAARPDQVNNQTLLPRRGPQAAAADPAPRKP